MSAAMADLAKDEKNDSAVLQIAEEEEKLNPNPDTAQPPPSSPVRPPKFDVKDRDPHHMNEHVKVGFR